MKVTSKEVNKMLKQLQNDYDVKANKERNCKTFLASVGEDVESCRPDYDFVKTQNELEEIEMKIIKLKHYLNVFNSTTVVPEFNKTVDEMLIYMPYLTTKKNKLLEMLNTEPKARELLSMRSTIIDYKYANYNFDEVKVEFDKVSDELSKAQLALDTVNLNTTFDVEL